MLKNPRCTITMEQIAARASFKRGEGHCPPWVSCCPL